MLLQTRCTELLSLNLSFTKVVATKQTRNTAVSGFIATDPEMRYFNQLMENFQPVSAINAMKRTTISNVLAAFINFFCNGISGDNNNILSVEFLL